MPTLTSNANTDHKPNKARKPVAKEVAGRCGIRMEIIPATRAMLHQGRYKQAAKLSSIINVKETRNFVMVIYLKTMQMR